MDFDYDEERDEEPDRTTKTSVFQGSTSDVSDLIAAGVRKGVTDALFVIAIAYLVISALLFMLMLMLGLPAHDSTDAADGTRSNMSVLTDYGTGLQYLETREGGLTPRLRPDGTQWQVSKHGL